MAPEAGGAAFVRVPLYPRWAVRVLGLGAVIGLAIGYVNELLSSRF